MKNIMKHEKLIEKLYIPASFVASVLFGMLLQSLTQPKELYRYVLFAILLGFSIWIFIWKYREKIDDQKVILLLFTLAFAARLVYILNSTILTNQHDTRSFSVLENNYGHTGYIRYLMENFSLPDFDVRGKSQFYHPPLHHLICAVWMKIQTAVGIEFDAAAENIQVLTLFYSMVSLFAVKKILDLLNVRGIAYYAAFSVVAFHPTFFLLAGSINNDGLSVMFIFLAVYAGLAWYRKPAWYRILAVGACIGLSMAAKLATGVIAPAMAFLFLARFVQEKGAKKKGRLIGQFAAFGGVCIPLGIGWQVRNFIRFGVPLTYVPRLSDQADQYLGGYSVTERFFDFGSIADFGVFPARTGQQGAEYFEHNIPLTAFKSSLFGEYSVWKSKWTMDIFANILFWIGVLIALAAVASAIVLLIRLLREKTRQYSEQFPIYPAETGFFAIYAVTIILSYVSFCFAYPHFCSMDFRYIVPLLLIGSVCLGLGLNAMRTGTEKADRKHAGFIRALPGVFLALVSAFSVLSMILYPFYF